MLNKKELKEMNELYQKAVDEFLEAMDFFASDCLVGKEKQRYDYLFDKQFLNNIK